MTVLNLHTQMANRMREQQLPLHLKLPDNTVFDSYFAGPNREAVDYLSTDATTITWLWGERSTGKTHLLQSVAAASDQSVYLPLNELKGYGPFVLEGYDAFDVVCIDQLDAVIPSLDANAQIMSVEASKTDAHGAYILQTDAPNLNGSYSPSDEPASTLEQASSEGGSTETVASDLETTRIPEPEPALSVAEQRQWEVALFRLFQEVVIERQKTLVVASRTAPKNSLFVMPDLASRLLSGPVFRLQSLNDEQRLKAIQLRASRRGLDLPKATGNYLLSRLNRDMQSLCELLDRLDTASLVHQSRLTIPLVKTTLDQVEDDAH